jgi:hypothetical protein
MSYLLLILILSLPSSAWRDYDHRQLTRKVDQAPIIVRATVIEEDVDPPLFRSWSGIALFHQRVRYQVNEVMKGRITEGEIEVGHILVYGSMTTEKKEASLSHKIFGKGKLVILLLKPDRGKDCAVWHDKVSSVKSYCALDENHGALPATEKNVKLIQQLLGRN